jgi:peptide/nickel transport system ATP-binding protein
VTDPTSGSAVFNGESSFDLATLSQRKLKRVRPQLQMIFQDPFSSLNPRLTVQQIIAEPLVIHRRARGTELEDRVVAMLRRVGIRPEYRTRYPHAFSGGQRQRIGIARALVLHPKLVVADEAVSALDVSVQAQIINLLSDLQDELGLTYLFIAHDLSVVRHIADRVAVMTRGEIVEVGPTAQVFDEPQHEYTRRLLASVLEPDPDRRMLPTL